MVYVNCPRRFAATGTQAAAAALLILGCSSAEINETVRPELVDMDAPKSTSAGLIALADHAQSLNARDPQANNAVTTEPADVDVDNRAFASVTALCANFVAEAKASTPTLLEGVSELDVHLKAPFCTAIPEPHAIPSNPVYERTVTLRLSNGLWERKQLAVKLARGFVLHPTYWNEDDPLDPGCPSIFRADSIEPIRVQDGYLVVIESGQNLVDSDEQGNLRFAMLHAATWCKEAERNLGCRSFEPTAVDGTVQMRNPMFD